MFEKGRTFLSYKREKEYEPTSLSDVRELIDLSLLKVRLGVICGERQSVVLRSPLSRLYRVCDHCVGQLDHTSRIVSVGDMRSGLTVETIIYGADSSDEDVHVFTPMQLPRDSSRVLESCIFIGYEYLPLRQLIQDMMLAAPGMITSTYFDQIIQKQHDLQRREIITRN